VEEELAAPVSASLYRLRRQTALRGAASSSSRRHVGGLGRPGGWFRARWAEAARFESWAVYVEPSYRDSKMSSGRIAVTPTFGTSTSCPIRRSTATEAMMYACSFV